MDELLSKEENFLEGKDEPHYSLVPWTKDEEGTPDDIVSIMAYLTMNARYEVPYPIFVDGQTARDRTVMMARSEDDQSGLDPANMIDEYEGKPGHTQIQWGRMEGRGAYTYWVGLDVVNRTFDGVRFEVEKMQIVVKSDKEIEGMAKKIVLPEDEGEWREIWDAYAAKQIKAHEEGGDGKEDKVEYGDEHEPDDAEEGPWRKKAKK